MACKYNAFYMKNMRYMICVDVNMDATTRKILTDALKEAARVHKDTGCDCIEVNDWNTKFYPPEIRREIEARMDELTAAAYADLSAA